MDSRWYLAQTLDERILSLREKGSANCQTDVSLAEKRLERWKTGKAFRHDSTFARFLASIDLSNGEFKGLLGQSDEHIQNMTTQSLSWVNKVLECLENYAGNDSADYLALVDPLISHYRAKLQSHADQLHAQNPAPNFEADKLVSLLTEPIAGRLRKLIQKTLILETNIARVENRLSGETAAERYESFIKLISSNEERLNLYLEYPVLIRRVLDTLEQWCAASCEFLERLSSDLGLLNEKFALASAPVVAITGGAGDVHCQGRSVHIIEFAKKKKVVYKPRSLAAECLFSELLKFLDSKGLDPKLRLPLTIDRGKYGWCEFVEQTPCKTESQIKRFYERHGVWLAVFYALGTCDLHLENLIASGEHPIAIDLETIFQPEMIQRKIESADDAAMFKLFDSVMSVGLLPKPVHAGGRSMDSSGIGALPDQILPFDVDAVENLDSDEIQIGSTPGRIGEIQSNPLLKGANVEAAKYHRQLKRGFTSTYQLLQSLKDELLSEGGWFDRFSKLPIRAVIRPTSYYGGLRIESLHPTFNRKYLDQDLIYKDLWAITRQLPNYEKAIPSERRQLLAGDIPYFKTMPDSTDIIGGDDTLIEGVLAKSGRQVAEDRLKNMGDADLKFQLWLIDASFQTISVEYTPILQEKGYPPPRDNFLDAAIACGDRLVETSVNYLGMSSWVCLADAGSKDTHSYKLDIIDQNMYSGLLGIALFLGYLYSVTGTESYKQVAEGCMAQLLKNRYSNLRSPGAYTGVCGLLYVNMHLARIFNYPDLHDRTGFALDWLPSAIEQDQKLDLIFGCASAIPVLLSYASYVPESNALDLARACGDHLLRHASQGALSSTLTWDLLEMKRGFSHGISGIAFGLSELAAATNEKKYFASFIAAVGEEAELLKGNRWTDIAENQRGVAWCHGATGIALSRMKMYQRHKLPPAKDEAVKALRFMLESAPLLNHVICHGSLGNLDPFILASQLFPEEAIWHDELQIRSSAVLKHVNSSGWKSKLASQVIEPGLMIGLAGIGFELLRLHASDKVPSVLCLESPI